MAKIRAMIGGGGSGTKGVIGTFTADTGAYTTVELGFRPSFLYLYSTVNDTVAYPSSEAYFSNGQSKIGYDCIHYADSGTGSRYNLGSTTNARIYSVDDTSFTFTKAYDARYTHYTYYAIE